MQPFQTINAQAPIRICDNGGWTDTWFAEYGAVCSIAVSPCAHVLIEVFPAGALEAPVLFQVENFGDTYPYHPGDEFSRHPLLEAAVTRLGIPDEFNCRIRLYSEAPPGGSMGTSAAVSVALLGALDRLRKGKLTPKEIAAQAHAVETEMLGQQSGIQDQLAAAYGGINYIEMTRYPEAEVHPLDLPADFMAELEARLALVYLGKPHTSSTVHQTVIRELEGSGPEDARLEALRGTAEQARDALLGADLRAYGEALSANTEAQANLHAGLVSAEARRVIETAREYGAWGWKVNGAGGSGGSVALLAAPGRSTKGRMLEALIADSPNIKLVPVQLEREGVRTWVER